MEKRVLIMGQDAHARAVEAYLLALDVPVVCFSSNAPLQIWGGNEFLACQIDGICYDDTNIRSFYWRCYDGVMPDSDPVVVQNRTSLFESWLKFLDSACLPMFNPYHAWRLHSTKPYQHMLMANWVRRRGLTELVVEPNWYGTPQLHKSRKGAQGGLYAVPPHVDLETRAPLTSQDAVRGETIRAFVFRGGDCLAYHINSNHFDYRTDPHPTIVRHDASEGLQKALGSLLETLWWNWAGIDLIIDSEGVWHLLDVNVSPMFLGWHDPEQRVLKRLVEALCDGT